MVFMADGVFCLHDLPLLLDWLALERGVFKSSLALRLFGPID
jgi:hypothetical protein